MKIKNLAVKSALLIVSIIIAVPITTITYSIFFEFKTAEILFENRSDFQAKSIEVQLCSELKVIELLESGTTASLKFKAGGNCHYVIKVVLESNKVLNTEFGYVTSGFNQMDTVVIENYRLISGEHATASDPNSLEKVLLIFLSAVLLIFYFLYYIL